MLRYVLGCLVLLEATWITTADDKCYVCNSVKEPNCSKSDVEALKPFIATCEDEKGRQPTACRKIVQQVEEQPLRIIRECAFSGSNDVDGVRKQGNKGIKMLYYQCPLGDNEKPCNGASLPLASVISFAICALLMIRM